ncbi:MAG TPA: DUF1844 domain-containing protein [Terriglobales bacterium]|nr:DUF1844 domain-containing protein [Terriglobales bacterium]
MAEKNKDEFVVQDRRRFSIEDGEVHDNPERAAEEPKEEVKAEAAVPPAPEKKAEVREFPKREVAAEPVEVPQDVLEKEQQAPPLSPAERKAGDDAFAQSSKKIDEQVRAQLGRNSEEFQMTFDKFIASLYMTALMQLGLLHEQGGQPRVDIIGARQTIDTLALLRDKTKGNLTSQEDTLLANSLYEVQMAYVEVTNALTRKVQPAPPGAVPNPFVKK